MKFDSIESAVEALKAGESIIVVDNEDRENEGDLVAVTEFMSDNTVNFMAQEGAWFNLCTASTITCRATQFDAYG